MLIFAAIHIRHGRSAFVPAGMRGMEEVYSDDPLFIARLLRRENARALHLVDHDAIAEGHVANAEIIRAITMSEDVRIPVQLCGGIRSLADADAAFEELAVDRIVLGTAAVENPDLVERLVREYSAKKIVIGLTLRGNRIITRDGEKQWEQQPVSFLQMMKRLGVQRVVYTRRDIGDASISACIDDVREFAFRTGLAFTVAGAVSCFDELRTMQQTLPRQVDSLVLDEPLYRNSFPCQSIWRIAEAEQHRRGLLH